MPPYVVLPSLRNRFNLHSCTIMLHGYRLAMECARKEHTALKRSREGVARATGGLQGQ